jgi:hypothetical protein
MEKKFEDDNEREEQQSTFNEQVLFPTQIHCYHHYSSEAKIKWKRKINFSAKGFLKEIHQRTTVEPSSNTENRKRSLVENQRATIAIRN